MLHISTCYNEKFSGNSIFVKKRFFMQYKIEWKIFNAKYDKLYLTMKC